jgi:hypothetical protein
VRVHVCMCTCACVHVCLSLTSGSTVTPLTDQQVNVTRLAGGAGDFDLFVDFDAARGRHVGYVIYGAAYKMGIEELTEDFIYSTGIQVSACVHACVCVCMCVSEYEFLRVVLREKRHASVSECA